MCYIQSSIDGVMERDIADEFILLTVGIPSLFHLGIRLNLIEDLLCTGIRKESVAVTAGGRKGFLKRLPIDFFPAEFADDVEVEKIFAPAVEDAPCENSLEFFREDRFKIICLETKHLVIEQAPVSVVDCTRDNRIAGGDVDGDRLFDVLQSPEDCDSIATIFILLVNVVNAVEAEADIIPYFDGDHFLHRFDDRLRVQRHLPQQEIDIHRRPLIYP